MVALGSERGAVQNPFLRYAQEAGWTYLPPEEALDLLLDTVLARQLARRNPEAMDAQRFEELRRRLAILRPSIEGNFEAWQYLKGIKTVFVEEEKRERNVRFLDLEDLSRNAFHVTDEFTFSNGTPPDIRTDLAFFVNGLPVLFRSLLRAYLAEPVSTLPPDPSLRSG